MTSDKLNEKQKRFCEEYVKDNNGTRAAIRAGYSQKTARVIASQHLTKLNIQEYIKELKAELLEQCQVEAHVVLGMLLQEARDFDNPGSTRVQAQIALGKHIGLFTDKIEHSGDSEFTRVERVLVYRNEDGDLVETDLETGEDKIISSH